MMRPLAPGRFLGLAPVWPVPSVSTLAPALSVAWALAPGAQASEALPPAAAANLEPVVVTAKRFAEPARFAAGGVTVITAADIRRSAAQSVPELLAQHAGVQFRSSDGSQDVEIDWHGFGKSGTQNTLVLLDGVRLNEHELTSIPWVTLPLGEIERIELQSGAGSVLYGGGATAGTIHIITRRAAREGFRWSGSVGVGSDHGVRAALSGQWGSSAGQLRVAAHGLRTDNYRRNNALQERDLLVDWRASGPVAWYARLAVDSQRQRFPGERRVNPGTGVDELRRDRRGTSKPDDYGSRNSAHLQLGAEGEHDGLAWHVGGGWKRVERQAYFASFGGVYLDTSTRQITLQPRLRWTRQLDTVTSTLVAGLDAASWAYDSPRSNTPAGITAPTVRLESGQRQRAWYLQHTWRWPGGTQVQAGMRQERVTAWAADRVNRAAYARGRQSVSVRAGELMLDQPLGAHHALSLRFARSYRLPTLDENFDAFGGLAFDSTVRFLKPQTSRDLTLALRAQARDWRWKAEWYRHDLRDEIHYNAVTFRNENLQPTQRSGLSLEGRWQLRPDWAVHGHMARQRAHFVSGIYGGVDLAGKQMPLVPQWLAGLGVDWNVSADTALHASWRYVGRQRYDNDQANTFNLRMPSYQVLDLKATRQLGDWQAALAVNNALNQKYYSYAIRGTNPGVFNAYPMAERTVWLTLSYQPR